MLLAVLLASPTDSVIMHAITQGDARPPLSSENLLVNELIREYLEFNDYRHSLSTLVAGKLHRFSHPRVRTQHPSM